MKIEDPSQEMIGTVRDKEREKCTETVRTKYQVSNWG